MQKMWWICPICGKTVNFEEQITNGNRIFDPETGEINMDIGKDGGFEDGGIICRECGAKWSFSISGMFIEDV